MSTPSSSSTQPFGPLAEYMRPPQHLGMQQLDRTAFDRSVPIISIEVEASKVGKLRTHPALQGQVLDLPKVKSIIDPRESGRGVKWIRLNASAEEDLSDATKELVRAESNGLRTEIINLGYDNWNTSEILSAVLPTTKSDDIPSSFTSTGHIAHMNLREEWLPYKFLIGQVILDKNPGLRTVVNKLDTIHAQYRYFDMEVIAGEKDYITTLNESNCTFTFDFSLVYWNSRLHHEHERLIDLFKPNSLVADVMAGVGPFVVPAAKRSCYVLGNDLNPEGVKWMRENRVKNHVENNLRIFEQDGAAFIQSSALEVWNSPFTASEPVVSMRKKQREERKKREAAAAAVPSRASSQAQPIQTTIMEGISSITEAIGLTKVTTSPKKDQVKLSSPSLPEPPKIIQHYIMNLPDSALTFLYAYSGCFTPLLTQASFIEKHGQNGEGADMPMVHVYCFTREVEREKAEPDILERASRYLSYPLTSTSKDYLLHHVRSVAPNKDMYCLSFRLPREVAFRPLSSEKENPK
ncbi:uncharacterized protein IL334_006758 [Kwoniella shivajii]|uniref:tRNA (guanine(37)-N1)-methyltransferase n=1 Tax=Kwoniella shivajii TaxID=564305 RepID=A0ABZ1D831_9TREE|nr:hypothetical protein IL334_006758 [Kwoniella shivajii]